MITVSAVEGQQTEKGVTLSTKLDKAEDINGTKYISIDAISFEGVKDPAIKASIVENIFKGSMIKEKSFAGYTINSLYTFFMLFVVMAGIASIILFFLSKKLLQMMNGVR
jgi:POT family proton-dependent oligopeptide transporter